MAAIYLALVGRGAYDSFSSGVVGSDFWGQHYNAEKECPKFVIDVLVRWFDRAVAQFDDGESWNFLDNCPTESLARWSTTDWGGGGQGA